MNDLAELYQQLILDHNRNPRHFGRLQHPTHHADGFNPVCGDRIALDVEIRDSTIRDVGFEGAGCAISRASASLMTGAVAGRSIADAEHLFRQFQTLLTSDPNTPVSPALASELGKLSALAGVRAFPSRIKCATLAWHALHAALTGQGQAAATTE